ncbi:MAG: ParB/RepB/Spo0J family partition protein [Armatimonadota bacterium]|nr:ParB/RepB/Spo0J family partition protein [bacterium]MDW8320730.1 ParB/RepB/Spo0J family partition protein [Armatimonadota bacterium]
MNRRGLGKGLSALISAGEETSEGILEIPLSAIVPNPEQPRRQLDHESIEELAASIREHGVLQPIIVQQLPDARYQLIAGERRWRAARVAGLTTIPAIVRQTSDEERLELALVENVQREDINAVDEAMAYRTLIERFGMTQEEVARKVGKSRTAVANTLRLLTLDAEILDGLKQGKISEGHARALLMAPEETRLEMYRRAVRAGWSVRETERSARNATRQKSPAAIPVSRETADPDPHILALEDRLRSALATKVQIRYFNGAGTIEIHFYDLDDLSRIIESIVR